MKTQALFLGLVSAAALIGTQTSAFAAHCRLFEHDFGGNVMELNGGTVMENMDSFRFWDRKWQGTLRGWKSFDYSSSDQISSVELVPEPGACSTVRLTMWEHPNFEGAGHTLIQNIENGPLAVNIDSFLAMGFNDSASSLRCECLGSLSPTEEDRPRPPREPEPPPSGF